MRHILFEWLEGGSWSEEDTEKIIRWVKLNPSESNRQLGYRHGYLGMEPTSVDIHYIEGFNLGRRRRC